jgi:hypothetical protein
MQSELKRCNFGDLPYTRLLSCQFVLMII